MRKIYYHIMNIFYLLPFYSKNKAKEVYTVYTAFCCLNHNEEDESSKYILDECGRLVLRPLRIFGEYILHTHELTCLSSKHI